MVPCACPGCRSPLTVPEALVGKHVRCPKCKNPFTVPPAAVAQPLTPPIVAPKAAPPVAKPTAAVSSAASRSDSKSGSKFDDDNAISPRPTRPAARRRNDEDDDAPRSGSRNKKSRTKAKAAGPNWLLIGGVSGGGLLFVVIAIVLTFVFTSGPGPQAKNPDKKGDAKDQKDTKVAVVQKKAAPPVDLGPLPDRIHKDNTQKVKQSTVRIKVTSPGGSVGEGSGFFALESGLVVTNAHVVNMLHRNQKPDRVEVFINSGQADEDRREAHVLGVDQDEDLALLKIDGGPGAAMLTIDGQSPLTELQPVYVFGFPLGEKHNAKITASESSVSSFKHRPDGSLQYIQVNGGMQPGNSGGPVVDARGNVVGVAVAGIRGTALNFAVPGDRIAGLSQGRVKTTTYGETYRDGDLIRMPIKLGVSDPMSRVRSMKLDVWTAAAGNAKPAGVKAPPMNDESPRKSVAMEFLAGTATGDVLLPTIPAGKAMWVQPVFVQKDGAVVYGSAAAVPINTATPLTREQATLMLDVKNQRERTLDITGSMRIELMGGGRKDELSQTVTAEAVEVVQPTGDRSDFELSLGRVTVERKLFEKAQAVPKSAVDQVKAFSYNFSSDDAGNLTEGKVPAFSTGDAQEISDLFITAYEATSISSPQKKLRPMDTWNTTVPLFIRGAFTRFQLDLNLLCTYEGTRTRGGSKVGFIRIEGLVEPRGNLVAARGQVSGHAMLDLTTNLIVKANVVARCDFEVGALTGIYSIDATVERTPGNDRGIRTAPKPPANPTTGPLGGKLVLEKKGVLKPGDPIYNNRAEAEKQLPHLSFTVEMAQNKNYIIDLTSEDFDTFLLLEGSDGAVLIEDDDGGGGLNSRIVYRCKKAGTHKIIVTPFDKGSGNFSLRVMEFGLVFPKLFPGVNIIPKQTRLLPPEVDRKFDDNRLGAPAVSARIEVGRCAMWHDAPRRGVSRDNSVPLGV